MHQTPIKQQGLTFSRLLLTCAAIGFIALIVMKLFPLYNESLKVSAALQAVANRADIGHKSPAEIKTLILKNFEVSDVDRFNEQNIHEHLKVNSDKGGKTRTLTMTYEGRTPLFGNLDVVMNYNESVTLQGSGID